MIIDRNLNSDSREKLSSSAMIQNIIEVTKFTKNQEGQNPASLGQN